MDDIGSLLLVSFFFEWCCAWSPVVRVCFFCRFLQVPLGLRARSVGGCGSQGISWVDPCISYDVDMEFMIK